MRCRPLALVLLTAVLAPPPAGAAGQAARAGVTVEGRMPARAPMLGRTGTPDWPAAWVRENAASLARQGPDIARIAERLIAATAVRARQEMVVDGLVVWSDIDGDGLRDLVDLHYDLTGSGASWSGPVTVTAFGSRGRTLWRRVLADVGFALPVAGRFGPGGRPGIALVGLSYSESVTGATYAIQVTTLGSDGRVLWRRDLPGHGSATESVSPIVLGAGRIGVRPTSDLVVATTTLTGNQLVGLSVEGQGIPVGARPAQWSVAVTSYRGDTGAPAAIGAPLTGAGTYDPVVVLTQDLNRDGGRDLLAYAPGAGATGTISARRGTNGALLWNRPDAPLGYSFGDQSEGFGDLTRDGVPDLLVEVGRMPTAPRSAGLALNGATGSQLGRIDSAELFGAGYFPAGGGKVLVTEAIASYDKTGLRVSLWTAAGARIWVWERTKSGVYVAESRLLVTYLAVNADLEPDGVVDPGFAFSASGGASGTLLEFRVAFSGRTGKLLDATWTGAVLAGTAAVDGRGGDMIASTVSPSAIAVRVRSYPTAARVWDATLVPERRPTAVRADVFSPGSMDQDRCADVLIRAMGTDARGAFVRYYVLDGRTGGLRWSAARTPAPRVRVHTVRGPAAARGC